MNTPKELWFAVAIGGFLIALEALVSVIVSTIAKFLPEQLPEWLIKFVAGLLIVALVSFWFWRLPRQAAK